MITRQPLPPGVSFARQNAVSEAPENFVNYFAGRLPGNVEYYMGL